eukprot:CAMPEP_0197185422 /NCGR_PEP_ID=MMETSP1423-20130617/11881_1 /TAXON_ID=476441 /ORGANISM="Pseudo-nitzschia heimii, Strain UNC1101" /LENGTH=409 /DNA_ID=CAMNT_0042636473 /DNA_START=148 /DNA_END=1374 /DNA_ORIENTATION=+
MKRSQPWIFTLSSIVCSFMEVESYEYLMKKPAIDLTRNQNLTHLDYDPLAVLGTEDMHTMKGSWGMTVNDQCLYEFVYEFQHPDFFPIGDEEHDGTCDFGTQDDPVKPKYAPDGLPYLKPRRYWFRFPDYIWAALGFNHLSVDWLPCGRKPAGYRQPEYELSFFRVTPEYRALNMVCKMYDEPWMTIVPFQEYCAVDSAQEDINGMNFFITPGALANIHPLVNMPSDFTHRHQTFGPVPYDGLRAWDESRVPDKPKDWNDIPVFMSTYAGSLAMWQAHIPYKFVNGTKRQFHSLAHRYWETTIQTIPDTWAVKYDERDGKIYFTIVGKSELCRADFERAERVAGGPPIFPDYDDVPSEAPSLQPTIDDANERNDDDDDDKKNRDKDDESSSSSFTSISVAMIVQVIIIS